VVATFERAQSRGVVPEPTRLLAGDKLAETMRDAPVLVFGTICLDRVRRVERLPAAGGYVEVEDERTLLGGEAANTGATLAAWGVPVLLDGNRLGADPDGAQIACLLEGHGLAAPRPSKGSAVPPAPVCDIFVTPDGERTMFGNGFRAMEASAELDRLPLVSGGWFTAEPNMRAAAREAACRAYDAAMRIYLMDFVEPDDVLPPGCFWQSSTDWAGHRNNTQRNVEWVKRWVGTHGCFAVLSDGPNGFVAGSPDLPVRAYPPFPAPTVVDFTGAGDVFRAGMLYGLSRGLPIPESLLIASAAGCLKCRAFGATSDIPSLEEIRRHVDANPEVAGQYR
jgi:sugar/nucleoside kinase (ribokinase family)